MRVEFELVILIHLDRYIVIKDENKKFDEEKMSWEIDENLQFVSHKSRILANFIRKPRIIEGIFSEQIRQTLNEKNY